MHEEEMSRLLKETVCASLYFVQRNYGFLAKELRVYFDAILLYHTRQPERERIRYSFPWL
jgi:hypothetical protein